MPRLLLAGLAAMLLAGAPAGAQAATTGSDAGDDIVVITGSVNVPRGDTVDGSVVVIDGPVTVAGTVDGDVIAVAGRVRVLGRVTGDVVAVSDHVLVTATGHIEGDLLYGDEKPALASGARVDGDVSDEGWSNWRDVPWGLISAFALWLAVTISSLALGLLLIALAPRAAAAAAETARTRFGPAVGWGFVLFFGVPLAAIIALATLVGIPLGLALLLALVPLFAVGYVTTGWVLGRRIVAGGSPFVAYLAGWGILRLLALIPFFGGLVWFAATVFGLGVLTVTVWRARTAPPGPAGPEVPGAPLPAR